MTEFEKARCRYSASCRGDSAAAQNAGNRRPDARYAVGCLIRIAERKPKEPEELGPHFREIQRDHYTVEGCIESIQGAP